MASQVFRRIQTINPTTNKVLKQFEFHTDQEIHKIIQQSHESFLNHRRTNFQERLTKIERLQNLIEKNYDTYAKVITAEMGKPITQSTGEVRKCIDHCKYYIKHAESTLKAERITTEAKKSLLINEPLGSIYNITPFNFPFWLVLKGVIPNLCAGNTVIVRTSDSTPITGTLLEDLVRKAGFDNFEYQNVFSHPNQLELIMSHKHVKGVCFTGSTAAGRRIGEVAGRYIKKQVLELGGCDPFIVLDKVCINLATDLAIKGRLQNAGQVCVAAKRVIVDNSCYDQFKELMIKKVQALKVGDPMDPTIDMGPLARKDLLDQLENQLQIGIKEGAKILSGGNRLQFQEEHLKDGNFFAPTLVEIETNNYLAKNEVFGPVIALIRSKNTQNSIEIANDSEYGLGACVIGTDLSVAEEVAKSIETGIVFVNDIVKSDSRIPIGGSKCSGIGRECGKSGLLEFTNLKTLWVA